MILEVYDLAGRRVVRLARGWLPAGRYLSRWPGVDARGRQVASGVFFVRLRGQQGTRTTRVTLLR